MTASYLLKFLGSTVLAGAAAAGCSNRGASAPPPTAVSTMALFAAAGSGAQRHDVFSRLGAMTFPEVYNFLERTATDAPLTINDSTISGAHATLVAHRALFTTLDGIYPNVAQHWHALHLDPEALDEQAFATSLALQPTVVGNVSLVDPSSADDWASGLATPYAGEVTADDGDEVALATYLKSDLTGNCLGYLQALLPMFDEQDVNGASVALATALGSAKANPAGSPGVAVAGSDLFVRHIAATDTAILSGAEVGKPIPDSDTFFAECMSGYHGKGPNPPTYQQIFAALHTSWGDRPNYQ